MDTFDSKDIAIALEHHEELVKDFAELSSEELADLLARLSTVMAIVALYLNNVIDTFKECDFDDKPEALESAAMLQILAQNTTNRAFSAIVDTDGDDAERVH